MLVRATRTLSALTLRALFYAALFCVVVTAHVAITTGLRAIGWSPSLSLGVSGAIVLGIVLGGVQLGEFFAERRAAKREIERMRQGLPGGPLCVVVGSGEAPPQDQPWDIVGKIDAVYPKLARRLGVEGYAMVEFEINADGVAKNVHCLDAWPSDVFFDAARDGLMKARFRFKPEAQVRFGVSYALPFVFRIKGAARQSLSGAADLRPAIHAHRQAVARLRGAA